MYLHLKGILWILTARLQYLWAGALRVRDWKSFYDLSSLGSGSSRSLDRIAPHAINNNYDSYLFTINNTIKDFRYMLRLFDGNNDMIKITNSFLKPYIKEQKKLGHNALISHRLKN